MNVNEYFDGKVKSIGLSNNEGKATVGVNRLPMFLR